MHRLMDQFGILILMAIALMAGCASERVFSISRLVDDGQFGRARQMVLDHPVKPADDPLREATLAILTLEDGLPEQAQVPLERTYENLRTRGLNARKQTAAAVLNERVKTWKGEPYEQALLYLYVAMQQAMLGSWDNARAASSSALALLDEYDRARDALLEMNPTDHGYVVDHSDLAFAHILAGLANQEIGRANEASDHFQRVVQVRPALTELVAQFQNGTFDTVLIVGMGTGPTIEPGGANGEEEILATHWPSDDRLLVATDESGEVGRFPRVLDVNGFADAYRWEGLRALRKVKSVAGSVLIGTGAVMVGSDDDETQLAGLGVMLGGLLAKIGSQADTRSLDVLPQRFFVVPINRQNLNGAITLGIGSGPGEFMTIPSLGEPGKELDLIVVRVPSRGLGADTSRVLYANDAVPRAVSGSELPWILGGTNVRTPTYEALREYQQAGWLKSLSTSDLRELYRLEGIHLPDHVRPGIPPGTHILEGGVSMATPRAGTLGFVRLFATQHPPYQPRSRQVRSLAGEIHNRLER